MSESIVTFDSGISTFIANLFPHNAFFDSFFSFLSLDGLTVIVWGIILLLFIIINEKRHKEFILYFLLSFITTYFVVNVVIKNVVKRDRPYVAQNLPAAICPVDYSFPSGHASGAFAGAVVFAAYDKKRKWMYYTLAVLISISRVYLLCHYAIDITFGALIGYSIGKAFLIYLPYKKIK
jgi:undecaprenyl-diphosphatase